MRLIHLSLVSFTFSFVPPSAMVKKKIYENKKLRMSEGNEDEWVRALRESSGIEPGAFEKEMKKKDFLKGPKGKKVKANNKIITWLEEEGDVYLADESSWFEAPHPLAISTQTVDEVTNESTGRGLLARRSVNEGDELLIIPLKLCITKESAKSVFGKEIVHSDLNEYLSIALQLIHEYFFLKEKSFYKPYLDVLPPTSEVNPTFLWSDDDLSFLEGSPVVAATKSLQSKLRREYDSLLLGPDGLSTKYPQLFSLDIFTYENWLWAFTMLFSRAVRLRSVSTGETLALVPYADLINHSPFSGAYLDGRESGDWLVKDGFEEVILYAERPYRKMEQIYISYGPKSNADLLLLYGFALERNPFNSVDVIVSISPKDGNNDDPLTNQKIDFLKNVGRDTTAEFPCYYDRFPTEMLEFVRLMLITEEDTGFGAKSLYDFDYSRTISASNEAAVLNCIISAVKYHLSKYPTTEEEDAELIQDKLLFRQLNYKQRMAVRHRRNEKRLLKRTTAALEKQLRTRGLSNVDKFSAQQNQEFDKKGRKSRSALEERLEKMGLPIDLK